MTGPIKPPSSSPIGTTQPTPTQGASEPARADFREDLKTVPEIPTTRAASTAAADPVLAGLIEELRAGRIGPEALVDSLVRRALESPMAASLTPAARAGLERTLRQQIEGDPAIAALVSDLGRAR